MALPNRILSYQKIVKGECNSKWKNIVFLNFGFAEPHPILFKDSERFCNSKWKKEVFTDLILPSRILSYSEIVKGESNYERTNIAFTYF